MRKVFQVLNKMVKDGVVKGYAVGGAVAVMFYTEPIQTADLDIFVYPEVTSSGMVHFGSIYRYLAGLGYKTFRGQCIIIEGVPVDFIPPDPLASEAMESARTKTVEGVRVKVFSPEYLFAICLQARRPKDLRKADLLREQADLDENLLKRIRRKHRIRR